MSIEHYGPATFGQLSLWRSEVAIPVASRPEWHFPRCWRVPGLGADRVRAAIDALARRHEALRSLVVVDGDALAQAVHRAEPVPVTQRVEEADNCTDTRATQLSAELAATPFDLTAEYGWRVGLLGEPNDVVRYVCIAFHHMVADTWALDRLEQEFTALLANDDGEDALPPAPQPRELAEIQQSEPNRRRRDAAAGYWRRVLDGYPRVGGGDSLASYQNARHRLRAVAASPSLRSAFAQVAARHNTTLQAVVLTFVLAALQRQDIALKEPLMLMTANRFDPRWHGLVSTMNQVTMLEIPEATENFTEFVGRVDWASRIAFRHGAYSIDDFTQVATEVHGAPLAYDYIYNFTATESLDSAKEFTEPQPLSVSVVDSPQKTGPVLDVRVGGDDELRFDIRADADLLSPEALKEMVVWIDAEVHQHASA